MYTSKRYAYIKRVQQKDLFYRMLFRRTRSAERDY